MACALISSAAVIPEDFSSAVTGPHSPQIELGFSALPSDSDLLDKRISMLKKTGFGSVLLTSIPCGSNSWEHIAGIAESCRKHSMKLGCDFFPQVKEPLLLHRIVWSNRVIKSGERDDKSVIAARGFVDKREITRFLMPLSYSNDIKRAYGAERDRALLKEDCVEHKFSAVPANPLMVNYLDKGVFEDYVNKFLLNAQLRLDNNYGTVFSWLRFPALPEDELVWTDNMREWFNENTGFNLIRNLPVLVWEKNIDDPFIKSIRKRYQSGLKRLWLENFAGHVRPLVREAGLSAAISVNQTTLPPEDYAGYFRYPLATGATGAARRVINRRAVGGARTHEYARQIGRVGENTASPGSIIDSLFADGVTTLLFAENITGFSSSHRYKSLDDLVSYVNRCSYVLLNSEPTQGVLLCSESIPETMNRVVFDSVSARMLKEAAIESGRVVFSSGRGGSTVVVSEDAVKSNKAFFAKLRSRGVAVVALEECDRLTPDLAWKSDVKGLDFRFVRRSGLTHEYFMIRNESHLGAVVDFTFKVGDFADAFRWQPRNGGIYEIRRYRKSSPTRFTLSLPVRPDELFFVVFKCE